MISIEIVGNKVAKNTQQFLHQVKFCLQPKIPERRQTPNTTRSKEAKSRGLPSPDRTCSPAVTRWKKAKELVTKTPEILRKARLEKQMKIAQKGKLG